MSGRSYLCTCPRLFYCPKRRIEYAGYSLTGNKNYSAITKLTNTMLCKVMQHLGMGSLGQILGKPCVHSRGHSFELKFMKLCLNGNSYKVGNWVMLGQKLGCILEKPCVHSRGQVLFQSS